MTPADVFYKAFDSSIEYVEAFTKQYIEIVMNVDDVSYDNKLMVVTSVKTFSDKLVEMMKTGVESEKFKESMNR
jgi:hypothetical protein